MVLIRGMDIGSLHVGCPMFGDEAIEAPDGEAPRSSIQLNQRATT